MLLGHMCRDEGSTAERPAWIRKRAARSKSFDSSQEARCHHGLSGARLAQCAAAELANFQLGTGRKTAKKRTGAPTVARAGHDGRQRSAWALNRAESRARSDARPARNEM